MEDERNIRELIVYTLESSGFTARGLESGKELNAAIAEQLPDLILLDIMLPGEDGLEILSRLKASEVTKEIPVIMVTAKGAEYDKVMGLARTDHDDEAQTETVEAEEGDEPTAEQLAAKGISAEVINMATIKPLDEAAVLATAKKTGKVITVEEHSIIGRLGEAVCSVLSAQLPTPVRRIGVNDEFGHSGPGADLLVQFGLCADHIAQVAADFVK